MKPLDPIISINYIFKSERSCSSWAWTHEQEYLVACWNWQQFRTMATAASKYITVCIVCGNAGFLFVWLIVCFFDCFLERKAGGHSIAYCKSCGNRTSIFIISKTLLLKIHFNPNCYFVALRLSLLMLLWSLLPLLLLLLLKLLVV